MEGIQINKNYYKNNNYSYSKPKKSYLDEENFNVNISISLKSKKTQSLSTNYDDKKDKENKEISITKNSILNENKNTKNNGNINCFELPQVECQIKTIGDRISLIKNTKANDLYNINSNIENLDINNNFNIIREINNIDNKNSLNKNNCINKKEGKNSEIYLKLKRYPPYKPELFNDKYTFIEEYKKNFINICYMNLNRYKIPHFFYNHMMVKNDLKKKSYLSCSITKRTKEKLITIIYYQPIKKN